MPNDLLGVALDVVREDVRLFREWEIYGLRLTFKGCALSCQSWPDIKYKTAKIIFVSEPREYNIIHGGTWWFADVLYLGKHCGAVFNFAVLNEMIQSI